jgi:hypothetical protein
MGGRMKRRDIIILAVVLVASLALYLLRPQPIQDTNATLYMQISIDGQTQEFVPLTEERDIRIELENGEYNVVHISPGGFAVTESNCYNQDCIHQGEVTADNIAKRVLANEIICLPHKLVLSLVSQEEAGQELEP